MNNQIEAALAAFSDAPLRLAAHRVLDALGYASAKTETLPSNDADGFARAFNHTFSKSAQQDEWKRVELLFQITNDELKNQSSLMSGGLERERFESFLFFAVELRQENYSRTDLANMAREINKPFKMPVIVLFRHGQTLSMASLHRRANKTDDNRDVLERVTLLKDIHGAKPHAAHGRILGELATVKTGATTWEKFLAEWNRVLDISELNKKFYGDYKIVFEQMEKAVELSPQLETTRRDWTQRLFNRLLFLRFLEKKGWLQFNGDTNYLRAIWDNAEETGVNFHSVTLANLFFVGLSSPNEIAQQNLNRGGFTRDLIGDVPYLNGGLFEQSDEERQFPGALQNKEFEPIFDLFERYYFTVDESTPTEQEIGIDPEMLGKVFEELVTGRHESGSYYTPRGIVSFMGREALKGYLGVSGLPPETIEKLVDKGEVLVTVPQARVLLQLVESVTICDPACGSGAYLMGMVSELVRLYELLEVTGQARTPRDDYERKTQIISRSIYGVDKDPFAVSIAMLRLWLSLMIDYKGEKPEPLPNLKYKIEVGDSLSAPLGAQLTLDKELVREFNSLKADYVKSHHQEKRVLETQIEELRTQLKLNSTAPVGAHDWRTEFAEVFENGGFDIVLANPPYVRQELIKDQKGQLKVVFGSDFSGTADLYVFFYLRAWKLLKPQGQIAFISPNKWFRAAYGVKLRAHFAAKTDVRHIVDFGELRVFQTAATFPMIFIAEKSESSTRNQSATFTQVKTLGEPYPDVRALVQTNGATLPANALNGANWNLSDATTSTRLETMRKSGLPLGEYVKGQIYYGVKTGFNEAFVIDEAVRLYLIKADKRSAELIKPMAKGDDVRRWRIEDKKRFLIVTKIGVEIKKYPAIFAHLKQWQPQLEARADQGKYWWELRACAYYNNFDKPKIVYPEIAKESRFAFDESGIYPLKTVFSIPVHDLFLLGVLNSQSVWTFMKGVCTVLGDENQGGRLLQSSIFIEQIPIPNAAASNKSAIESLVETCLRKRGVDCADEEAEIEARVAALYGL